MSLLYLIENVYNLINKCDKIQVVKCNMQLNNKQCNFYSIENKIGIKFEENVKEIYSKYKNINLMWEIKDTNERGCFKLIPFDNLYSYYIGQIEISEGFLEYDDMKHIVEDIKNWIPFCTFPNGDAFCIDKRNKKVVFYEHEVFDSGVNLHGLIIAKNIEDLIVKWSKVLFMDIYDWYDGVDAVDGIDLTKDVYKNIIDIANEY